MIGRGYPEVPVRTKVGLAPVAAVLFAVYVLGQAGAIETPTGPSTTSRPAPAAAPPLSRAARADIPPAYLRAYQRAARTCSGLTWAVLAGVGKVESDHGRTTLPGVHSGANWAGAAGPMQLGIGGKAGPTWQHYGDGVTGHVYQIGPAALAAARKLCHDGARRGQVRAALYAYNPSSAYVDAVLAHVRRYQGGAG